MPKGFRQRSCASWYRALRAEATTSSPGYEFNNWFGILAPRATPNNIIAQLHGSIVRALQVKEVKQVLLAQSIEPAGASGTQLGDMIRQEISTYTKLVKDIGGVRVE